jgi:hypothetical protein
VFGAVLVVGVVVVAVASRFALSHAVDPRLARGGCCARRLVLAALAAAVVRRRLGLSATAE